MKIERGETYRNGERRTRRQFVDVLPHAEHQLVGGIPGEERAENVFLPLWRHDHTDGVGEDLRRPLLAHPTDGLHGNHDLHEHGATSIR